jgi:hypothetical protein
MTTKIEKYRNPIKTFLGWILSFLILPYLRFLSDFQLSLALVFIFTAFYYLIDGIISVLIEWNRKRQFKKKMTTKIGMIFITQDDLDKWNAKSSLNTIWKVSLDKYKHQRLQTVDLIVIVNDPQVIYYDGIAEIVMTNQNNVRVCRLDLDLNEL